MSSLRINGTVLFSVLPLLCACDVFARNGNGHRVSEQRALADFDRIDFDGSFDVAVEQRDEFEVTVRIDSNLVKFIDTRVEGDTLFIDSDEWIRDTVAGPHVIVTLPELTQASMSGSGDLELSAIDSDQPLALRLNGSGNLRFDGTAPSITARVDGSGDLELVGTAEDISLRLDGSGNILARKLSAETGEIDLRGSGDIEATIHDSAEVSLQGSGDIDLFGGASITRSSRDGSGAIHQHD